MPRPYNFDKMLEIGETLSRGIKMLRVDFYEVNKKLYIGELSFFSDAGFMWYSPDEYNEILGSELDLS